MSQAVPHAAQPTGAQAGHCTSATGSRRPHPARRAWRGGRGAVGPRQTGLGMEAGWLRDRITCRVLELCSPVQTQHTDMYKPFPTAPRLLPATAATCHISHPSCFSPQSAPTQTHRISCDRRHRDRWTYPGASGGTPHSEGKTTLQANLEHEEGGRSSERDGSHGKTSVGQGVFPRLTPEPAPTLSPGKQGSSGKPHPCLQLPAHSPRSLAGAAGS